MFKGFLYNCYSLHYHAVTVDLIVECCGCCHCCLIFLCCCLIFFLKQRVGFSRSRFLVFFSCDSPVRQKMAPKTQKIDKPSALLVFPNFFNVLMIIPHADETINGFSNNSSGVTGEKKSIVISCI